MELSEQEIVRRQSLQTMREMGIDPYPAAEYVVTGYSTEIKAGFVDEGEGHVGPAGFIQLVFLGRHIRLYRHFLRTPAHNFPHFAKTGSYGGQLVQIGLGHHTDALLSVPGKK